MKPNKKQNRSQIFIHLETLSAYILLCVTILALILSNTSLNKHYNNFFENY